MQCTTHFHHEVTDAVLPQTDPVFHDATPLDTAVDVLDAHAAMRNRLMFGLLFGCSLPPAWLLGRHDDLDLVENEGKKAEVLEQPTPGG